jgi:hypothetical protein
LWWIVPIANWFQPYRAMEELWERGGEERRDWRLPAWWAAWLGSSVLGFVLLRYPGQDHPSIGTVASEYWLRLGSDVVDVVAAALAGMVVTGLYRRLMPIPTPPSLDSAPPPKLVRGRPKWAGAVAIVSIAGIVAVVLVQPALPSSIHDAASAPSPRPVDTTLGPSGLVRFHVRDAGFSIDLPFGWTRAAPPSDADFAAVDSGGGSLLAFSVPAPGLSLHRFAEGNKRTVEADVRLAAPVRESSLTFPPERPSS